MISNSGTTGFWTRKKCAITTPDQAILSHRSFKKRQMQVHGYPTMNRSLFPKFLFALIGGLAVIVVFESPRNLRAERPRVPCHRANGNFFASKPVACCRSQSRLHSTGNIFCFFLSLSF
jgi:hypothetical protein